MTPPLLVSISCSFLIIINKSFVASVELSSRDGNIQGSDSLKCLGVTIDKDYFQDTRKNIAARLRNKTWTLTRLKHFDMSKSDLEKVYISLIRPTAEYAAVAWHSLHTEVCFDLEFWEASEVEVTFLTSI